MDSNLLGHWGESLAAEYLRKKGYQILSANFRCRMGEIDLIAQKKTVIVFVEVKLRKNADFAQAMEFVDRRKQQRIKIAAEHYLAEKECMDAFTRFDVIEIYAPLGAATKKPEIRHLEDAFQ